MATGSGPSFDARVRETFGFDGWTRNAGGVRDLFVWGFDPAVVPAGDWLSWRSRRVRGPDGRWFTRTLWRQRDDAHDRVIRVDVLECESAERARLELLNMLGHFEFPRLAQLGDEGIGEVAFGKMVGGRAEDSAIAFSRANLVVFVQDAGATSRSVLNLSRVVDTELRSTDPGRAEIIGGLLDVPIPLAPKAREPLVDRRPDCSAGEGYYKFLSTNGEVVLDGGAPTFLPTDEIGEVEVLRVGTGGPTTSTTRRVSREA